MRTLELRNTFIYHSSLISAVLLLLAGCGGSGSDAPEPNLPPIQQPENLPPEVSAGEDQSISAAETVSLNGSATDSDGTVNSFSWSQTSGTTVQLSNADDAIASFIAPNLVSDETLTFELVATDNDSATGVDSVNILVVSANRAPFLELGEDKTVQEGLEFSVTAEPEDSDGTIEKFQWELLSVSQRDLELRGVTTERVTFTAPIVGQNEFVDLQLTVEDNQGAIAVDTIRVEVVNFVARLNDTGITSCGDFAVGASNQHGNQENCGALTDRDNDPIPVGQDGQVGLDLNEGNDENGHAGFDFTKLDNEGSELTNSASEWHCVRDNITGLIWEVKQAVGGLHDATNTYSWFSSEETDNGGSSGTANGGVCAGSDCDTESFVAAVNEVQLCGAGDWSIPSREQLRSIVDYSILKPAVTVDLAFFPNSAVNHWTSTAEANRVSGAWMVSFLDGSDLTGSKNSRRAVRLVRSAE